MNPADKQTEKLLREMERKVRREYKQATREVEEKLDDYLRRFEIKDQTWRRWVAEGKKTKAEYKQWRTGQLAIGERWEELRLNLAEDFANADKIARSIVLGYMPEVYALNHNYAVYEIEHGLGIDTSYTLYDAQTVERLFREDLEMLPPPGRETQSLIAQGKAVRWNQQRLQSVMMQSILQGEAIPAIATRLAMTVGESDRKAAVRNARTMTTGAQNAGRIDGYIRAQAMGIELKQQWVATLDVRTRPRHRELDGETAPVGGKFSNGLRFPGDPEGPPAEVYNCRCTVIASIKGHELNLSNVASRNSKLEGMSYSEWKRSKKVSTNPILLPEEKASAIRWSYVKQYMSW